MINKILKDIDNEESYYVGTNGCLYQDLGKEELLAIKQEIERLNKIIEIKNKRIQQLMKRTRSARIDKALEYIEKHTTKFNDIFIPASESWYLLETLKGSDKE